MNFLAHFALAQDASESWQADDSLTEGLLAGALIGDFIKGPIPTDWPQALQWGVRVHRRVDAQSNKSRHVRTCSDRYSEPLRRYAPIFVDLIADHHLCTDWLSHYPQRELAAFSQRCFAAIEAYANYLPSNGQRFFSYMRDENLLMNFDQWEHLERGLHSVLRRLDQKALAVQVMQATQTLLPDCRADCSALHKDLQAHWQTWHPDQS